MKWWFEYNKVEHGPLNKEDIQQMIIDGDIERSVLVWNDSELNRKPAFAVKEFWLPPTTLTKKHQQ
ncbi:GYF domain-containing protein [Aeromonas enteropelogenes]|uniref:GYF domain-containing protein n=1 Tax=Aeromonas enteropelogenes TaxID=29489 RepID=UPI003BA02596